MWGERGRVWGHGSILYTIHMYIGTSEVCMLLSQLNFFIFFWGGGASRPGLAEDLQAVSYQYPQTFQIIAANNYLHKHTTGPLLVSNCNIYIKAL